MSKSLFFPYSLGCEINWMKRKSLKYSIETNTVTACAGAIQNPTSGFDKVDFFANIFSLRTQ